MPLHASHGSPAAQRRGVVLGILFVLSTLNYLDRQVIGILATPIKRDLALTDAQLGALGGFSFAILYSTMAVPIALLADRRSRIGIISVALATWSLFTALSGAAASFVQLFVFRIGVGFGEAGGVAPSYSLICDYFPAPQRARALSIYHLGVPIGSALGLALGGVVAAVYGWRSAFLVVGAIGILIAPVMYLTIREPIRGGLDPEPAGGRPAAPTPRAVLALLAGKPSFWLMSVGMGTGCMLLYGFGFWLPTFLQRDQHLTLTQTSLLFGLTVLTGGIAGNLLSGWLADRLGPGRPAAYALVASAAFVLAIPFILAALWTHDGRLTLMLLVVPQACGIAASSPIGAAIQHICPPAMRSTVSATYMLICNMIGAGLGALSIGWLADGLVPAYGPEALRHALIVAAATLYPLTALFYYLASRRLPADWHAAIPLGKAGMLPA